MKILFCSNEQFMPLSGGGSIGNFKIVENLAKRGHKVTVATPLYVYKSEIEKKYNIECEPFSPFYIHKNVSFRGPKYLLYGFLYAFHFLKLILKEKYDVVLVRNALLGIPAALCRPFTNAKYILSFTDFLSSFNYQNRLYPNFVIKLFLRFEQLVPRFFDRVYVITPEMKRVLVRRGVNPDKIHVSYDGVETSFFNPEKIRKKDINEIKGELGFKDNIAIFLGTVDHHSYVKMRDIVNEINKRKINVNFVFIGQGRKYDELKKDLKKHTNTRFLGYVEHSEVPKYIAAANVGIIPYENNYNLHLILTLKLLEYLSMGTHVVCTDLKSIKEIFGKYSFLKIAKNNGEFVDAINEFKSKGKSKEAQKLIRDNFSWQKVTDRICQL
ncbi:MAG TPA: glycosyltransferase family 4 protein [Candidatus Nanoarchaeia archaeon]|nr:glycosyltransferase family 4 protein [Candidatus Nanoarchaeia archaeon]